MNSLLETIGDTPLIRLDNITRNLKVNIFVKLEFMNPSGSIIISNRKVKIT